MLLRGARTWNLSHTQPTTSSIHSHYAIAASLTHTTNTERSKFVSRLEQDSGVQKMSSPNLVSTLMAGISLRTVKLN